MATSTNMNPKYFISQFVPAITVNDPDNINQNPVLDVFNPANIKTRAVMQSVAKYKYYHEHIPALARNQLGNTSCWWMIMLLNGQNHPLTIDSGELLDLPNIDLIRTALQVQANNQNRFATFTVI